MPTNDFKAFATDPDALVITQIAYLALAARTNGFQIGIAEPDQLNKVWRQAAFVAAALGQTVSDVLNEDVLDDGDLSAFVAQIKAALGATSTFTPTAPVQTDNYTADGAFGIIPFDASSPSGGECILTVPAALGTSGSNKTIIVMKIDETTNPVIITEDGSTELDRIDTPRNLGFCGSRRVILTGTNLYTL